MNSTTRFTDRVTDYVSSRPCYPDELVDLVERETGIVPGMPIADIGCGTGLSAEPFLRRGHLVTGVEPNAAMRAAAADALSGFPLFRVVDGTGERTGLDDRSVDCIVTAQAFHWLDVDAARVEFDRVLRDPGWVVLAWNTRHTAGTAFLEGYEALLREFGTDYEQVAQRTASSLQAGHDAGSRLEALFRDGYERRVLPNEQKLDLAGLSSRLRSASYTPPPDDPAHEPMMSALSALHRDYAIDGHVSITYDLELYIGRLR